MRKSSLFAGVFVSRLRVLMKDYVGLSPKTGKNTWVISAPF